MWKQLLLTVGENISNWGDILGEIYLYHPSWTCRDAYRWQVDTYLTHNTFFITTHFGSISQSQKFGIQIWLFLSSLSEYYISFFSGQRGGICAPSVEIKELEKMSSKLRFPFTAPCIIFSGIATMRQKQLQNLRIRGGLEDFVKLLMSKSILLRIGEHSHYY